LVISTVVAILFYALMHSSSNTTFIETLGFLVVSHGVLAIGFALGARLPWASRLKP
jgi:hypothetical protein